MNGMTRSTGEGEGSQKELFKSSDEQGHCHVGDRHGISRYQHSDSNRKDEVPQVEGA